MQGKHSRGADQSAGAPESRFNTVVYSTIWHSYDDVARKILPRGAAFGLIRGETPTGSDPPGSLPDNDFDILGER
jgi:hypothetical protein